MKNLLIVAAVLALAACAAPKPPADANAPQAEEPVYRTGSTIPRRSKAASSDVYTVSREELERSRQLEMQRQSTSGKAGQ